MTARDLEIEVVVDAVDLKPILVGRLFLRRRATRGDSATFLYDAGWLARSDAYAIDPQLPLDGGQFHTTVGTSMFRALSDSAPDRWGVELARRSERRRAVRAGQAPRSLGEADLLLAVQDPLRQGALRLRNPSSGDFIAPAGGGVPALIDLPRLLNASIDLERDRESDEDLQLLLAAGARSAARGRRRTCGTGARSGSRSSHASSLIAGR